MRGKERVRDGCAIRSPAGHGRGQVKRSRERERHDSRREELTMMQ